MKGILQMQQAAKAWQTKGNFKVTNERNFVRKRNYIMYIDKLKT